MFLIAIDNRNQRRLTPLTPYVGRAPWPVLPPLSEHDHDAQTLPDPLSTTLLQTFPLRLRVPSSSADPKVQGPLSFGGRVKREPLLRPPIRLGGLTARFRLTECGSQVVQVIGFHADLLIRE